MFTHRLYRLDPGTGQTSEIAIPVANANPRAIEIDSLGQPWVVLGMPKKLAVMSADSQWRTFDVGMYPHSLAVDRRGKVWFNGHFTHSPELIGNVDAGTGKVATFEVPAHPGLGQGPGGPIPYEIRVGPDGKIWGSELLGNRIFAFDGATGKFVVFPLPLPHSGPRRLDVDAGGIVWIPSYAANGVLRFDPRARTFTEIPLPLRDAIPYIIRVDHASGALWIGTAAADALLRYDPATGRFESYRLPSRGAVIRHLAIGAARSGLGSIRRITRYSRANRSRTSTIAGQTPTVGETDGQQDIMQPERSGRPSHCYGHLRLQRWSRGAPSYDCVTGGRGTRFR